MSKRLASSYYLKGTTLEIARGLIGQKICTQVNGKFCSGIINETEAYCGVEDRAAHSYSGKRTSRTEVMFKRGGLAYVYLCSGIHEMMNVVTQEKDVPEAVLLRSIIPIDGIETMIERRKLKGTIKNLCNGPGKLAMALGINRSLNGISLHSDQLWIESTSIKVSTEAIQVGPRIGVDYAGNDALLPYRFYYEGAFSWNMQSSL